jgi:hypothetical protein
MMSQYFPPDVLKVSKGMCDTMAQITKFGENSKYKPVYKEMIGLGHVHQSDPIITLNVEQHWIFGKLFPHPMVLEFYL